MDLAGIHFGALLMSMPTKTEPSAALDEEERLVHALISRGLLTHEEVQECRKARPEAEAGTKGLLNQLVKAGFLTASQARRTGKDLEVLMHQQIPGFQLQEKLGSGSMGTVYKARQLSMDRPVAIKILSPKLAANKEYITRFTREAHMAAKLSSANVVQAIDVGSTGPLHYFIMEFVEGTTVKEELLRGKVYSEREALEIVLQVAQALDNANRRQLVHRDVKPANIIMTKDGHIKLADLGLARQVEDQELDKAEKGLTIGTPYYIAPELIQGRMDADIRADIYSLGATLYHMVTGRPPFPQAKVKEVLKSHLTQELTPPDHINRKLSAGIGEVVEFMMAKDRQQRYRDPANLIIDLECLLRGEPPKLARQRTQVSALEDLAKGVVEEEDEAPLRGWHHEPVSSGPSMGVVILLVVLLGVSVLLNLIQLIIK